MLLLLSVDKLRNDIWINILDVNLLLLQQLNDLLKLIFSNLVLLLLLLFSIIIVLFLDDLMLNLLPHNICGDMRLLHGLLLVSLTGTLRSALISRRLLFAFSSLLLLFLHHHLLLLLHQHHLLLVHLLLHSLLHLLLSIVLIIKILSAFLVILLNLITISFIFNVLATSHNLLRAANIFKDHLLGFDILDRFELMVFLARLLLKETFKLLGQLELARVLIVLLFELLEKHFPVLVIQLVQINHHLLFVVFFVTKNCLLGG